MKTKQITVTEENDWEGETFSYILEVDEKMLSKIKEGLKDVDCIEIEENTSHTKEDVKKYNKISSNSYADRFQFCKIEKLPKGKFKWYDDVFYKGKGLEYAE